MGKIRRRSEVFWGLGGGTGAEMTSIGLGGVVAAGVESHDLVHWLDRVGNTCVGGGGRVILFFVFIAVGRFLGRVEVFL